MLTAEHMKRLWIKQVRIYGHRWKSSYGIADDGTWLAGLRQLTPEQLAVGVVACMTSADKWPPSMPEFRAMCLDLPGIDELVQKALTGSADPVAERLCRTVDSFSRSSLSRYELSALYRANAREILKAEQVERSGGQFIQISLAEVYKLVHGDPK